MKLFIALISGIVFGMGLAISQMVDPQKVHNFLSITDSWDPSLIFVMLGAISFFALSRWLFLKNRSVSIFGDKILTTLNTQIDKRLVIGSIIFGLGWGITGLCPGPALANLSNAEPKLLVFLVTMILGMRLSELVKHRIN